MLKKRFICFILSAALLLSLFSCAYAAEGSLSNFSRQRAYNSGLFSDVSSSAWYYSGVKNAYEFGFMSGAGNSSFNPNGNITIAETITIAAQIHSIYYGESVPEEAGIWYQAYVDYAIKENIISADEYTDYSAKATRAQFAYIIANSLPASAFPAINSISSIPDVSTSAYYSSAVYMLYDAGILQGNDEYGTFTPNTFISRASVSIIASKVADSTLRTQFTLQSEKTELTAEEIYAKCSPAVFYIEVYDANGKATASGSGFFIDSNGTAVTNYHVIDGISSAKITLSGSGATYDVAGVYDCSEDEDWAVIKVNGSGFSFLPIADKSTDVGGATVYAIGSPLGLQNTISQGLISNPSREEDGISYIQTSAAISSGSSGGALINKYGEVIGITSASYSSGQNLNLALPIWIIEDYSTNSLTSFPNLKQTVKQQSSSTSSGTSKAVYTYLSQIAQSYGTYASETYTYVYQTAAGNGYKYYYYLKYDPSEDEITISCYIGSSYSGQTFLSVLTLTPTLSTPYLAGEVYVTRSSQTTGVMYITPEKFTSSSDNAAFSSYNGTGDGSELAKVCHDSIYYSLKYLEEYVLGYGGYTLKDLGFSAI